MNRIQFFVVTALSAVVAVLLFVQLALAYRNSDTETTVRAKLQAKLSEEQQLVAQGNVSQNGIKQMVTRIYNDSQRTGDPKLKDLLAREQFTVTQQGGQPETPVTPPSTATH
jgi:hypothetical protein